MFRGNWDLTATDGSGTSNTGMSYTRCRRAKAEDQTITCVLVEGGPCSPCKMRAALRHQIKQLEEEITKLKAQDIALGSTINEFHDPFTHKFPPEIASNILRLSLPSLNKGERAIHGQWSIIPKEWAAPLKLGSVCRKWRQLAWATPDLWTIVYIGINPSMATSTAESLPGLLHEWLGRSGVLPLTIHFFHGHGTQYSDSSSEGYSHANDTRMTETLEIATCLVIDILNSHSSRWRNVNLTARAEIFERFSSSVEPKQLVTLELTSTSIVRSTIVRVSPFRTLAVPKFMMDSELNPTHLKLTDFPLTSINVRWDNITHATLSSIAAEEGLDFLRRSSSLEFYCVFMYGSDNIDFTNPILHSRLRSLDLSARHSEYILEAINLPSLEEWTMDMGSGNYVAAMLSLVTRSGCRLKVLNLDELHRPCEHLDTLFKSLPSLERIRLSSIFYRGGNIVFDIMTRIFCSVPGGNNISGELTPPSESFLPHLQVMQCSTDQLRAPFSWDSIPELYRRGYRRSVTLKAFATHADITDETALQLLQLTEEGVDLQIVDLTMGGDFLQNFRKRCAQGV